MIEAWSFSPCALCRKPGIAESRGKLSLCLLHWREYADALDLEPAEAMLPENRQRLMELGAQTGYPALQIWDWMRLCAGRAGYLQFGCWHKNPVDTQRAVRRLEEVIEERAKQAAAHRARASV